jgi:zinc/manganese transport system substrate-binding protein
MKAGTVTTLIAISIAAAILSAGASTAYTKVKVVASTTDLASIAEFIGGDKVEVQSIAIGTSDPHYVEVLPSYMMKVARADIYLKVGMDLDRWANDIIDGSRNGNLVVVDCSQQIEPLQRPTTKVDASMGDVHPQGNPHYWLDPENGLIIAEMITNALAEVDGENFIYYAGRLEEFQKTCEEKKTEWLGAASRLDGLEIITFHNSWPYFTRAFGIVVAGFVEPKPGINPTPSHTAKIVEMVKARNIRVIGVEPYFSRRSPDTIARMTEARVVTLPPSVGGADGADDYFSLFDTILATLEQSLED